MLLSIAGASQEDISGTPEEIIDLRVDDAIQGTVSFTARPLFGSAKERKWLILAELKGIPLDTAQKRYLRFSYAGQEVALAYAVSNKGASATPFSWNVSGPTGEISLPEGQPIQVTISTGPVAATKVRFPPPLFIEQSLRAPLQGDWLFCEHQLELPSSQSCPSKDLTIPASTTQTIWAYPPAPLVGKFAGNLSVFSAEKPDGQNLSLTLLSTTLRQQRIGIVLLAIGIILAWIFMVLVQRKASHDQLLLPALEIDAHVQQLHAELANAPPQLRGKMEETSAALAGLSKTLKPSQLESLGLPFLIPRLGERSSSVQEYQAKIAGFAGKADGLDIVVNKGLKRVWEAFKSVHAPGKEQAIFNALRAIDALSSDPNLDAAKAFQGSIEALKVMDKELAAGGGTTFAELDAAQTVEKVRAELRSLSLWAWVFFGLVSWSIGSYILVMNNPSFGTWTDYGLCLLWGFGLPVGGSQLTQLSVGSLAGVFGFPLTKTA